MTTQREDALKFHRNARGKVQTFPTVDIRSERQLAMAYVPGSAAASEEIIASRDSVFELTGRGNRVAEISNGSAIFGIGRGAPEAVIPMLEGKALLLKQMGDINAYPIAIDSPTADGVISFCRMIAPSVGAIDLEDIASPDAYHIFRALDGELGIPIFCDNIHGTAIVVLSAVNNSLMAIGRTLEEAKIVVVGSGTSGGAAADLLLKAGARDLIVVDRSGIISTSSTDALTADLAGRTNARKITGGLAEAINGADVIIGLSSHGAITPAHIEKMNDRPIVLSLALPEPEISARDAENAGAYIYASGRIDDANTILNIHAFPGLLRGALEVRADRVTDGMMIAAAKALSNMIDRRHLTPQHIFQRFFGGETVPRIAEAVAQAAIADGVAKSPVPSGLVFESTWHRVYTLEDM